jgi:hypothetical protein
VGAQLVDIDLRRGEADAKIGHVLGFVHHRGDVQQRLGGNAADVQANAAERGVALDDDRLHAEVGRAEGGGVAAGPGAEHEHFAFQIGAAAVAGGDRGRCSSNCCGRLGFWRAISGLTAAAPLSTLISTTPSPTLAPS